MFQAAQQLQGVQLLDPIITTTIIIAIRHISAADQHRVFAAPTLRLLRPGLLPLQYPLGTADIDTPFAKTAGMA